MTTRLHSNYPPKRPASGKPDMDPSQPLTAGQGRYEYVVQDQYAHPEKPMQQSVVEAGYSPASARTQASRMLRNAEFAQRLDWLRKQTANANILTVTERKTILSQMGKDTELPPTARIRALRELNGMEGIRGGKPGDGNASPPIVLHLSKQGTGILFGGTEPFTPGREGKEDEEEH